MAKKLSTGMLVAIGGAAVAVTGAAAVITRWAIKKANRSFLDSLDDLELEVEVYPDDEEEATPENDFVDTEGAAEVTAETEEAPTPAEQPEKASAADEPEA